MLMERGVRERLSNIIRFKGLGNKGLTFHALKCSGVTLSFGSKVLMEHIRAH